MYELTFISCHLRIFNCAIYYSYDIGFLNRDNFHDRFCEDKRVLSYLLLHRVTFLKDVGRESLDTSGMSFIRAL